MTARRVLTLYSKPGCHLCEELRARVAALEARFGFTLGEVDITGDPTLHSRYREAIPVLLMDGVEIGRGRIDQRTLVGALEAAWPK